MTSRSSAWSACLLVISAWGLAFSLAAHLSSTHSDPGPTPELADMLLGESRQLLSISFLNEADMYFHKGAAHKESTFVLPGPFHRWKAIITPAQHLHAEGAASAEILPWLKLATHADPHNVEAFLVAAFWARTGLNRQDLAGEILDEAQRLNPSDYRVAIEKGRQAIMTRHYDEAIPLLEAALSLHSHTPSTPDRLRELMLDRAEILTFLGFLKEARNERATAIQCFKDVLAIFPERSSTKDRMELLAAGNSSADSAQSLLDQLTKRTVHDTCKDENHQHQHEHDDHDE